MEKIKIIDNFFPQEQIDKIVEYFDKVEWLCKCNHRPNANLSVDVPFWRHELIENDFFKNELRKYIECYFNKSYHVKRVYAVGQTYEQNSNFHIDDRNKDVFTVCLYINKNIKEEDEGYFYIKVPNEKHILAINPLFNRIVFFPADYRHKGTGTNGNKDTNTEDHFRICIAWKLKERNNINIPKFIQRKEPAENSIIPKRILQMFKHTSIHPFIYDNIMKILEKNKQYEYHFMIHEDGENLIKEYFDDNVLAAFKKVKIGSAIGDFIRYVTLYIHGGIYLDLDADISTDLDAFIKNKYNLFENSLEDKEFIFFYDASTDYKINQWLIMTKPKNIIIKEIINEMVKRIHNGETNIFLSTGPTLFTDVIYNLIHNTNIYGFQHSISSHNKLNFVLSLNDHNNKYTKNGIFLDRSGKEMENHFKFRIKGYNTQMLYQDQKRYNGFNDNIFEETKYIFEETKYI